MHAKHVSGTFFFHRVFRSLLDNLCERRSLHEGPGFSQDPMGGDASFVMREAFPGLNEIRMTSDERRVLELGGELGAVGDGDDPAHDGMNAADVGVTAGSESWKCKGAVRKHETGVEGAVITLLQTAGMGDGMFRCGGIFPLNWRPSRDDGGLRYKVGGTTLDNDGRVRRRRGRRPGREQSQDENQGYEEARGHGVSRIVFFLYHRAVWIEKDSALSCCLFYHADDEPAWGRAGRGKTGCRNGLVASFQGRWGR